ncbi:MAG: hypothetical protein JNL13_13580 [Chitinophagaceae bacterium]|nr:hypothetical protein [Chitinophagaceae bacterium]
MKLLCSILAFMLLALSCIPCADAGDIAVQPVAATADGRHSDKETGSGHEHRDLCSPFCQCSCCALAYALPQAAAPEFSLRLAQPRTPFASYLQQKPTGIALPVWQPPQSA